jgi:hypothetical protein
VTFDEDTVVRDFGRCADLYTDKGREEIPCPPFLDRAGDLLKLYEAATQNRPVFTDGQWGKARRWKLSLRSFSHPKNAARLRCRIRYRAAASAL